MMRITSTMMADNTIRNINNNMQRLSDAQEVGSTGEKIQQASEDPVAATKGLKYRSYVAQIEQYQSNATDATSWMETTEDALSSLTDVVQQIRDLTVEASDGTLSDSELEDISAEVSELQTSAVEILNTQYAGRYVFGGYNTDSAPYATKTSTITNSTTGDTTEVSQITFKGDYLSKYGAVSSDVNATDLLTAYTNDSTASYASTGAQSIKYNTGYSSNTAVNVEGQDATGTGTSNLFDTLNKLLLGLAGETSYQTVTGLSGTATTVSSTSSSPATIAGAIAPSYSFSTGDSFTLTVDETDYTVNLDSSVTDVTSLQNAINNATDSAGNTIASGTVTVSANSKGGLTFTASAADSLSLTDSTSGDSLSDLGFDVITTDFSLDGLLDNLDTNLDSISTVTASLGARMNYVETCTSRLASDYTTYTGLLSSTLDADLSVATTEYSTAQTIYDASLTVGAKVLTKSLVDYIT